MRKRYNRDFKIGHSTERGVYGRRRGSSTTGRPGQGSLMIGHEDALRVRFVGCRLGIADSQGIRLAPGYPRTIRKRGASAAFPADRGGTHTVGSDR